MIDSRKEALARLRRDVRRFYKHAAVLGVVLGFVCHMLPPHYRAVCNAIASLCGAEGK